VSGPRVTVVFLLYNAERSVPRLVEALVRPEGSADSLGATVFAREQRASFLGVRHAARCTTAPPALTGA